MGAPIMRLVEFKGAKYEVKDWANWIAQDHSGSIMAFEKEPVQHEQSCWDIANDHERWHVVKPGWRCPPAEDWKDSLIKIT
jgi:hypothetical protein